MSTSFPLTEAEQLDLYGRILNAEDRALYLKDREIRARHGIGKASAVGRRHNESDDPEPLGQIIQRILPTREVCRR